jgi:EAL domain-containing protein (putative c-di-GMP-specific phosphodiesterase class I)
LREQLERWHTPAGALRLEITESVLITEGSRVRSALDSLSGLGVHLSLDDFGTGYSPLSYLRELPVDEIKIDCSFVWAMMTDKDTAAIVAAIIALARRLGVEVVAEGIETPEQLELLRSFHCPVAQGYYISRPLPAEGLEQWLDAGPVGGSPIVGRPTVTRSNIEVGWKSSSPDTSPAQDRYGAGRTPRALASSKRAGARRT